MVKKQNKKNKNTTLCQLPPEFRNETLDFYIRKSIPTTKSDSLKNKYYIR